MSIFRINKSNNFVIVCKEHLKNKNLSLKAKGLLTLMLSLPEDWEYSINGLVAICKENATSIKSTLNELKKEGYLKVTKIMPSKENNGRICYLYDVYESKIQDSEKQGIENLGVEFLGVENQLQYNTNNIYTDNNINSNNNKKEISIINEESINEEKEINKEKEEIDIFQYVEENFGRTLSPIEYEEISSWEDNDLTRYAIKQTILKGIYNLNYIKRILENYKLKKISTIEQAKQEEANFRNGYSNKIKQVVELDDYDWLNE